MTSRNNVFKVIYKRNVSRPKVERERPMENYLIFSVFYSDDETDR